MSGDYVRCDKCRGARVIRLMGGITADCSMCKGAGRVKVEAPVDTVLENVAPIVKEPEIKPSEKVIGATPAEGGAVNQVEEVVIPKKPIEQELRELSGYTPIMIEAIMREPSMKPDEWRRKYSSVVLDPLSQPKPGKQYLPDLQSRAKFRENVARQQKPAPRKHNTMKTHDIAGNMEGIE